MINKLYPYWNWSKIRHQETRETDRKLRARKKFAKNVGIAGYYQLGHTKLQHIATRYLSESLRIFHVSEFFRIEGMAGKLRSISVFNGRTLEGSFRASIMVFERKPLFFDLEFSIFLTFRNFNRSSRESLLNPGILPSSRPTTVDKNVCS